ncbi:MAG TPA: response regulator [Terriglobales bacterium]|nr:response regulator [Terriglobales bacterium]
MSRARSHHKATVLVIDDALPVSTTLVWVFRESGYNCAAVGSRAEAVQVCSGLAPDVALIEMSLPDASGVDTARDLRNFVPGCRMLLMSSDPEAGDELARARAVGVTCELIPKPIPVEELLHKVKAVLARPA